MYKRKVYKKNYVNETVLFDRAQSGVYVVNALLFKCTITIKIKIQIKKLVLCKCVLAPCCIAAGSSPKCQMLEIEGRGVQTGVSVCVCFFITAFGFFFVIYYPLNHIQVLTHGKAFILSF